MIYQTQNNKNWFVYCHYKPTGEIFYVGIGRKRFGNTHYQIYKRAYETSNRNFLWKRVYHKYKDRIVRIEFDNLEETQAKEKEKLLIQLHGRVINNSGCLCNISEGGEGRSGDHSNSKKVSVYSLGGEFIREFSSVKEAAYTLNLIESNIRLAASMKRKTCGNYQFRYEDYKDIGVTYFSKSPRITSKPILATKNGITLEFESSYKFMKFIGLNKNSHINECLNGKRKRVMGWELKFKGI